MAISVGLTKSWVNKFGLVRLEGTRDFLLIFWMHMEALLFANQQIQIHCLIFLITTISNIDVS